MMRTLARAMGARGAQGTRKLTWQTHNLSIHRTHTTEIALQHIPRHTVWPIIFPSILHCAVIAKNVNGIQKGTNVPRLRPPRPPWASPPPLMSLLLLLLPSALMGRRLLLLLPSALMGRRLLLPTHFFLMRTRIRALGRRLLLLLPGAKKKVIRWAGSSSSSSPAIRWVGASSPALAFNMWGMW